MINWKKYLGGSIFYTGKGLVLAGKGLVKGGVKTANFLKPTIDRVIDPAAAVIGSNVTLSTGIHYLNNLAIQPSMDKIGEIVNTVPLQDFFNSNSEIETGLKLLTYTGIYGFANAKIIPKALKLAKRKTKPTKLNWLKTAAITGATAGVFFLGGVKQDYERISEKVKKAVNHKQYATIFNKEKNTLDKYLSGEKSGEIISKSKQSLNGLENVVRNFFSYEVRPEESKKIEKEQQRIKQRKQDFSYTDNVSSDAQELINEGLIESPEQLVYLARATYFEGAFDRKAKNKEDLEKGLKAISSVMYNRLKFDKNREKKGKSRVFSKKGDNLFDLVFHHRNNKRGVPVWQFTCIRDFSKYFYEHEGKQDWDMYQDGKLNVSVGKMNPERTKLTYEAIKDVFTNKEDDPTNGALFYQNIGASDKYNKNWKKRGLRPVKEINSHTFYRPTNLNSKWAEKMNLGSKNKSVKRKSRQSGARKSWDDCGLKNIKKSNSKGQRLFRHNVTLNDYENQQDAINQIVERFNTCDDNYQGDKFPKITSQNIKNYYGNSVSPGKDFPTPGKPMYVTVRRKR